MSRMITDNKSLIDWLEKKDPAERYNYTSGVSCLLAQYFREMGVIGALVNNFHWGTYGDVRSLPEHWNSIAMGTHPMAESQHTFGAALERARTLVA